MSFQCLNIKNVTPPFILYDDACSLCSEYILFINRNSPHNTICFVGMSSSVAVELVQHYSISVDLKKPNSIILIDTTQVYYTYDAIRKIGTYLNQPWNTVAMLLGLLPRSIGNTGYNFLATRRLYLSRFFRRRGNICTACIEKNHTYRNTDIE